MTKLVMAVLMGVMALAVAPVATTPALAAPQGFSLEMDAGGGLLHIDDAAESYELETPTTFTGTVEDGADDGGTAPGTISGGTFSTPPIEFDVVAQGQQVHVKATFTEVSPGTAAGSITASGDGVSGSLTLRTGLRVRLDLRIGEKAPYLEQTCTTSPVALELTGPFTNDPDDDDPGAGTIVDPDFTIPEFPAVEGSCITEVVTPLNGLLAGSGHSLSLDISGDLEVPLTCDATTATLAVSPSGGERQGRPVTMTATVAPAAAGATPTGLVTFLDSGITVGTAELVGGTAELTTPDLVSGDRSLTARYGGDADYCGTTSAPVVYRISPAPTVSSTLPDFITIGAPATEFDLTVANPASGSALDNARVDVAIFPPLSQGFATAMEPSEVTLEQQNPDNTWSPVTLTKETKPIPGEELSGATAGVLAGSIGAATGSPLAAGATTTRRMRITVNDSITSSGVHRVAFELLEVNPGTGAENASLSTVYNFSNFVRSGRIPVTSTLNIYDTEGVRPGYEVYLEIVVCPATGSSVPTGTAEFLVDGRPAPFRVFPLIGTAEPVPALRQPVGVNRLSECAYETYAWDVPADFPTGNHQLSVRYFGDDTFQPATSATTTIPVAPPLGPLYDCVATGTVAYSFGAYFPASIQLPALRPVGTVVPATNIEVEMVTGGFNIGTLIGPLETGGAGAGTTAVEVGLGPSGSVTGTQFAWDDGFSGNDTTPVQLPDLTGSVTVQGAPGEVMPVPLSHVELTGTNFFAPFTIRCEPVDEPVLLDEITVAGTTLEVEAPEFTRIGDLVVLRSSTLPARAGVVEFRDGATSLGFAPVDASGTAAFVTTNLGVGSHSLTATFNSGQVSTTTTSTPVALEVLPLVDCEGFAGEGNEAVVRLVYMELLLRCPDQAGFDYWVAQLDGGRSPASFARAISVSFEAVSKVVDDGYMTMLGRHAEQAGLEFWVPRLQGTGRYDQLLADLAASPEFSTLAGGTNEGFVERLYTQLLRRDAEPDGVEYWAGQLDDGLSKKTVTRTFANLTEPLGQLVADSYDEILDRTPTGAETTAGIAYLRSTGSRSGLYADLIGTADFDDRAQEIPNFDD